MTIQNGSTVSIEYTLALDNGVQVDGNVGGEPLVYVQGGGQILPSLEEALEGLEVDEKTSVKLSPEEGYGVVDERAFQTVPAERVPEEARKVGTMLMAKSDQGERPIRVHEVSDESIVLDFNHPLAGQTLNFDVRVVGVESA